MMPIELITLPGFFAKIVVDGQTYARIDAQRDSELWRLSIYHGTGAGRNELLRREKAEAALAAVGAMIAIFA
jgi:hypothetical protein